MADEGLGNEGHGFSKEFIEMYESYFPFEKVRPTARWLPKRYCNGCHTALWKWWNEKPGQKILHLKYAAPMGWPLVDPLEHKPELCYGCVNFGKGGLTKIKAKAKVYESVPGVSLPVLYEEGMVVPKRPTPPSGTSPATFSGTMGTSPDVASEWQLSTSRQQVAKIPELYTKEALDELVVDLELGKGKSENLASRLKHRNLLMPGVNSTSFRTRDADFKKCFKVNAKKFFAHCPNILDLMTKMGIDYVTLEWRLFIDSSKNSLKVVLLHYTNKLPTIPIAYSSITKEDYKGMKNIIEKVKYGEHLWRVCCDLKVVAMLTGLKQGYCKYMCFLCDWDTRYSGDQYNKKTAKWSSRPENYKIGKLSQINPPLVAKENILLPYLHIKLGIVKNFIKAIVKRPPVLIFLKGMYRLREAKLKEGNFNTKSFNTFSFIFCSIFQLGVLDGKRLTLGN